MVEGAKQSVYGWDTATWRPVLVDGTGRLIIVTAAGVGIDTHCHGYDGAAWQRLRVMTPADAFVTPTMALQVSSFLMGYDGADWNMVRVDAAGQLQVDVLSSALPAGAATAANQATIIGHVDGIEGALGQCYGYDGANWQTLRVMTPADAFVTPTMALQVSSFLMGYNGATWDRLRLESAAAFNLRVKLYDGANGIDSDLLSASNPADALRGLIAKAMLFLSDSDTNTFREWRNARHVPDGDAGVYFPSVSLMARVAAGWNQLWVRSVTDAITTAGEGLATINHLLGYNGTTWDRLRTESAVAFNLRVKLYDGANGIDSDVADAGTIPTTFRGLGAIAVLYGNDGTTNSALEVETAANPNLRVSIYGGSSLAAVAGINNDNITTSRIGLQVGAFLHGFNGSQWDRLRTYGTGILKVGRAEVGLLDVRLTAVGQVGAAGARKLYWLACNPSAGNSVWEITDDTDGSTAIRLDCFSTAREAKGFVFDPPMEFTNGIYLKTFTNMTSCIFGYL